MAGTGTKIRQWLMTGVSYMIPFVAAGGILIALAFLLAKGHSGGATHMAWDTKLMNVTTNEDGSISGLNPMILGNWAFLVMYLGKALFAMFVPILAAYIAYAIADRPGLAPGFVAGILATGLDGNPLGTGTGFLGAILGGMLAGLVALWISRWKVASWIRPLMPVVIIPLLSSVVTGIVMFFVLKAPVGALVSGLTSWLGSLSGGSLIALGVILGLMMAFDMGGPVNKVAYTFAATGLTTVAAGTLTAPQFQIMAIVMAAGMTPPLGLALATVLRKNLFSESELENGKAAWLLGASFISEGAIPFAAADPLRVIPSIMIGSGVTGALVAMFGNNLTAPHGGIFVIPLVSNPLMYLLAIAIGTAVTGLLVVVAKGLGKK